MGHILTKDEQRYGSLRPGQKVRLVRTVSIAVDIDIREFLAQTGEDDITPECLAMDIEDNWDISTMLDQWDDAEITDISVEVTEIL